MTITRSKLTFADYLTYDDGTEQRYELIDGELIALPPEAEPNSWIALNLCYALSAVINRRLLRPHHCEVQVPVLQSGDAQNRFPDL